MDETETARALSEPGGSGGDDVAGPVVSSA